MSDEKTCEDCCCFTFQNKYTDNFGYCEYYDADVSPEDRSCGMYEQLNNPNFGKE